MSQETRTPRRRRVAEAPKSIEPDVIYTEREWSLYTKRARQFWIEKRAKGEIRFLRFGTRGVRYLGSDLLAYLEKARAS